MTNGKPMTDERLVEIDAYWRGVYHSYYMPDIPEPPDTLHDAICHVEELCAEIDRLRAREQALEAENEQKQAQIDAMRPIVEAVAKRHGRLSCAIGCRVNERWMDAYPIIHERHAPDCFITQARAFVAAHPEHPATAAAGEAVESEPAAGVTFADTDGSDPDAYDEAESEGE